MHGFQGPVHHVGQAVSHRVQVHGVLEAGRERSYGLVGVIASAIEPPAALTGTGITVAASAGTVS